MDEVEATPKLAKGSNPKIAIIILSSLVVILLGIIIVLLLVKPNSNTSNNNTVGSANPTTGATYSVEQTKTDVNTIIPVDQALLEGNDCTEIISGYYRCNNNKTLSSVYVSDVKGQILGPNGLKIEFLRPFNLVEPMAPYKTIDMSYQYSISPSKDWMYVQPVSERFAREPGDPGENDLFMIDIKNAKSYKVIENNLFAVENTSWSPEGNGFAVVANDTNQGANDIGSDLFYCTTTCKLLTKDAGPSPSVIGEAPKFINGILHYTGINGNDLTALYK